MRELLAEAARRLAAKSDAAALSKHHVERLLASRFDRQRAFITDPARRKAALCTRRAGKTEADSAYLLVGALGGHQRICLFMARTRLRAKELTWKPVLDLLAMLGLVEDVDFSANLSTLTISFQNGSEIRWRGADNIADLRRKRGDKLWLVIIDESQDIEAPILRELAEDVLGPALSDLRGTICLTGTPGHVCAGYWHGVTRPDVAKRSAGWSVHSWSVLDNPYMEHMRRDLPELKVERGWSDDHPTWLREWRGQWVNDTGALFYRFDPERNLYDQSQKQPWGDGWYHVRAWDLGHTDAMALVYWGFHPHDTNLYEVYSWKASGVSSDAVQRHAQEVERRLGLNVIGSVADTGGLGKVVVEEVGKRSGEHYEAAKKTEKAAHVRLMNDDFLAGRIKLASGSPYHSEIVVLPKVADWDEAKTGRPAPEDPRFDNHCCFVAGTMIETARGRRSIETVLPGDLVMTRKGWRIVRDAACSGQRPSVRVTFSNGAEIVGTHDHPVWTQNRGWSPLDALTTSDVVLSSACEEQQKLRQSNGMDLFGADGQRPEAEATESTSRIGIAGSIGRYGALIMETFLPGVTSIMWMATRTTTRSAISPALTVVATFGNTQRNLDRGQRLLNDSWQASRKPGKPQGLGTVLQKVAHGIDSIQSILLQAGRTLLAFARCVAGPSAPNTHGPRYAAEPVTPVAIEQDSEQPVYNLTVSGEHEYFANGILVSNCDSGLYGWRWAWNWMSKPVDHGPKPGTEEYAAKIENELQEEMERQAEDDEAQPWWEK